MLASLKLRNRAPPPLPTSNSEPLTLSLSRGEPLKTLLQVKSLSKLNTFDLSLVASFLMLNFTNIVEESHHEEGEN